MKPEFWGKNLIWRIMPKDTPKMIFLDFAATKNSPLMCRFLGGVNHEHNEFFDSVWEKSDSLVKCKNALGQSDCRIFKP